MSSRKGTVVLMGSGELSATMVEVHKKILSRLPDLSQAVFLDTPAGFQLNVDEISRKAVEYFRVHVQKQLKVASYKSSETTTAFEAEHIDIQGIGNMIIRKKGRETIFGKGEPIPFQVLTEDVDLGSRISQATGGVEPVGDQDTLERNVLSQVATIEASFRKGLAGLDPKETTHALLALDSIIWSAHRDFEDEGRISQAREILRESIVLLVQALGDSQQHLRKYLSPLVEQMLQLRATFRNEKKWSEADRIRDMLQQANILVEDTIDGNRWQFIDRE